MQIPYSILCTLFNYLLPYSLLRVLLFVFQDGGTALMAASESDRTGVVQLLSSSGEPKDGVRHNINNGQQLPTWFPKTIFQFLASNE